MDTLSVSTDPPAVGVPHSSSSSSSSSRTEAKSEHDSQYKFHATEWTSSSTTLDSDTGNNTTGSSSSSTSVSSTGSAGSGGYRGRQNGSGGGSGNTGAAGGSGSFYRPAHYHPGGRQNYNNYQNYGRQQSNGTHHHHQGYYNSGGYYNNNRRYSKRPFYHPPPQQTTNSAAPAPGSTDYFYPQQQHNYYMRNHHHSHHHQQPTTTGIPPPPLPHLNYGQPWSRHPPPTELGDYKFLGVVEPPVATSTPTGESAPTLTTVDGVILQFDKTVAPPSVVVLKEEELTWPLTTTIVETGSSLTLPTTAVSEMKPKGTEVENVTTTVALGKNYCSNPYQNFNPEEMVESFQYYEELKMPKVVIDEWEGLSTAIWKKFTANQQTRETFSKKIDLWKELFEVIQHSFPTYGLQIVGSTISGFGSNTSDIDMCLLIRRSEVDQRFEAIDYLHNLWAILKQIKYLDKIQVIYAKVPILKFHDKVRDVEIDLNCNNSVGIRNTHLLYNYSQCDWRVRPLVLVVKLWAQFHGINDAKNMTLSSYSLVLMVIHFLQTVSPPVLPCLQQCHNEKYLMMDLIKPPKEPRLDQHRFESKNQMSLGELMVNFLQYFAVTFDYNYAVSVRTGSVVSIKACQNNRARKNDSHQWKYLCIEEPFEYTNTARSVYDRDSFDRIRGVFFASWQRLAVCNDLDTIFTPIQICEARQIGTRLRENVILVYKKLNEIGEKNGIGVGTNCMTDRQMICAGGERGGTR